SDGRPNHLAPSRKSSSPVLKRIRFDVSTYEGRNGRRELVAETTIEGPEGTDFHIKIQGERFSMDARFLNDLVAAERLQVRANLKTRRLYGRSERELPLYEEDTQKQTLQVSFDEKIVLLPFGRADANENSDQLTIEITPNITQSRDLAAGKPRELEINIVKSSPGNQVNVEAMTVPHRFALTATLLEDGREVASGQVNEALIEERQEIILTPNGQASAEVLNNPIAIGLGVNEYMRRRPQDQVAIGFGVYRLSSQFGGPREAIASNWSGIGQVGSSLKYDISDHYLKSGGRRYELMLTVKLAPGEEPD
ncbi:MAG TPA: hypothetical protein VJS64_13635, partial [Pyrinomonadaceae bacterium]|nr:hypothetical protein [Pyrinomonadaceae bacterium]